MAEEAESTGGGGDCEDYNVPSQDPFFQVSPEASFWAEEPTFRLVTADQVIEKLGGVAAIRSNWQFDCPPTQAEIDELVSGEFAYARRRVEFDDTFRRDRLGEFLTHPVFIVKPPAGTTVNNRVRTGRLPIVRDGGELATMFEAEKTAVWHQHVILTLLDLPGDLPVGDPAQGRTETVRLREVISPVRQALMQTALHAATFNALSVIWRLKWRRLPAAQEQQPVRISRRERPSEYFERHAEYDFTVLYDAEIRFNADGDILRDVSAARRARPATKPGTPRHPAYGSGHSTYSKAASEILKVFLPRCWGRPAMAGGLIADVHGSLDKLANSIGESRFWGGVHWRRDHEFGQAVGQAVADLLIEQLDRSLIDPRPSRHATVPDFDDLETLYRDILRRREQDPRLWDWREDGPFPDIECIDGVVRPRGTQRLNLQGGRI
ncbi:hypothetical protein [Sphingomonas corticis]|uniref:Phosphatidic acid phosphatase type 2/haloperoxidase domain-containing protein n=1 Tax=Sphingomonas corticis TaxID=2722791 RepID=A0ABX1CRH9_9SPHN|nr:hypothetical protein [Sphingomonas corticis]NJR80079.1 hypothetical protein [Sphingomonas corticis]